LLACLLAAASGRAATDGQERAHVEPSGGQTDPRLRDTDGDGTSDLVERQAGTSPARGGVLTFPEPMVFDLVRGLDSEVGEVEVNMLVQLRPRRDGTFALEYAPEIEWVFAHGLAVELELPFEQERLAAVKGALQGLVYRSPDGRFLQGWQILGEVDLPEEAVQGAEGRMIVTHIGNLALSERLRLVSIVGLEAYRHQARYGAGGVANLSLFYTPAPRVTLGVEGNLIARPLLGKDRWLDVVEVEWRIMPQVHLTLNHHVSLQLGLGAAAYGGAPGVEGALRAIVEF
jgi:hypothetical protein